MTATLLRDAAKPRQAPAREAPRASIMESPAHLYPARVRLSAKVSELERAQADLSEYTAKAERAAIEEDRAMADEQLTETQAAAEISRAQNERNVYRSRQAQREKAINTLSAELKTAIGQASMELQGLVNQEMARRLEIIGVRVLTVLDPRDRAGIEAGPLGVAEF